LASPAETLRRTPLFDRHEAAGAKLVPFAGWEMPVQYDGIKPEHIAVRTSAGLFDVSHMGRIDTKGPDAERFLQHLLSNDVTKIAPGGAQYSLLCREDGGVLDDLFTYRFGDGKETVFLTVTNAANHERDKHWFETHTDGFDVEIVDITAKWAMLALQGPEARTILARHLDGEAPARMRATVARVAGVECVVAGTGYTGEDGVELLVPAEQATVVWDALVQSGAKPTGLGARDTLRLEACFHLYGNDLSEDRNPVEAGLKWAVKLDTGFIGADALRDFEPTQLLVPFAFTGPGIPRPGNEVLVDGARAGIVTSGTLSPCLDYGIGMAYVPVSSTAPGTPIEVDVRGKLRPAEVRSKPLYSKDK
jgi:aminomethyltransferase